MTELEKKELQITACHVRMGIVDATHGAKAGHPGGSLSATEMFTYLYFKEMNIDPKNPTPRYADFTVPIEKRAAPRQKGATSMGFAAEGLAPGQRFPGDTQGEAEYRAAQKAKQKK